MQVRVERQKVLANKNSLDSCLQSFAEISSDERKAVIMKGWEIVPMMSSTVAKFVPEKSTVNPKT